MTANRLSNVRGTNQRLKRASTVGHFVQSPKCTAGEYVSCTIRSELFRNSRLLTCPKRTCGSTVSAGEGSESHGYDTLMCALALSPLLLIFVAAEFLVDIAIAVSAKMLPVHHAVCLPGNLDS